MSQPLGQNVDDELVRAVCIAGGLKHSDQDRFGRVAARGWDAIVAHMRAAGHNHTKEAYQRRWMVIKKRLQSIMDAQGLRSVSQRELTQPAPLIANLLGMVIPGVTDQPQATPTPPPGTQAPATPGAVGTAASVNIFQGGAAQRAGTYPAIDEVAAAAAILVDMSSLMSRIDRDAAANDALQTDFQEMDEAGRDAARTTLRRLAARLRTRFDGANNNNAAGEAAMDGVVTEMQTMWAALRGVSRIQGDMDADVEMFPQARRNTPTS
ncbi:hypothetical protein KJ359_004612 [Pestalotiopsis sp. 9143b]|nr:hypothetical protein KJ359_004612 [Pestalotiopsis sp. 9143b]